MSGWPNSFTFRRPEARRSVATAPWLALLLGVFVFAVPALAPDAARGEELSGRFLVAQPSMPDPRFAKTVILMLQHDSNGAMGVIVNRPLGEIDIADLLEQMGAASDGVEGAIGVHYGGPVEPWRALILHSDDAMPADSRPVGEGFAVTGRAATLRAIAEGSGPKHSLFALGYSGWRAGQLESEMERADWFTAPADPALVFTDDPSATWQRVMDRKGVDL